MVRNPANKNSRRMAPSTGKRNPNSSHHTIQRPLNASVNGSPTVVYSYLRLVPFNLSANSRSPLDNCLRFAYGYPNDSAGLIVVRPTATCGVVRRHPVLQFPGRKDERRLGGFAPNRLLSPYSRIRGRANHATDRASGKTKFPPSNIEVVSLQFCH